MTEDLVPTGVTDWLRETALSLASVQAGAGFGDLDWLRGVVDASRVVCMGEATHGTAEFFRLKHRLLEWLVVELGFTALAVEGSFFRCRAVDDYIRFGDGDAGLVMNSAGLGWTLNTREFAELVEWMSRWNGRQPERQLRLYGFDIGMPADGLQAVMACLETLDPVVATSMNDALRPLSGNVRTYRELTSNDHERTAAAIAALLAGLDARRDEYVEAIGEREWSQARLTARILLQAEERWRRTGPMDAFDRREEYMAENILGLLALEGPDGRVAVWAHNGHVARGLQIRGRGADGRLVRRSPSMGSYLSEALGPGMVSIGFAFGEGSFRAMDLTNIGRPREFTVPLAPIGTIDRALADLGRGVLAVDLRSAAANLEVAEWLSAASTHSFGAGFQEPEPPPHRTVWWQEIDPPDAYDALIFVRSTTASTPNE